MMEMWTASGWRVTARKKLRGGSAWATMASSSLRGVAALARATSSRLCSTISLRTPAGWGIPVILGLCLGLFLVSRGGGRHARGFNDARLSTLDSPCVLLISQPAAEAPPPPPPVQPPPPALPAQPDRPMTFLDYFELSLALTAPVVLIV